MFNRKLALTFIFLGLVLIGMARPRKVHYPKPNNNVLVDVTINPRVIIKDYVIVKRVSAYNPVPWQTDADPEYSACGPTKTNQIAVSRDLLHHVIPCGAKVTLVTKRGEVFTDLVVWDTMNARYQSTADFMMGEADISKALDFGITSGHLILERL